MRKSIPYNPDQCVFDFDALNEQPFVELVPQVVPVLQQAATHTVQELQPRTDFFTYRLIRGDTGLPFYIGKGCGKRNEVHEMNARNHKRNCNHRICNTIRKLWTEGHRVIHEKIAENITEASAFAIEKLFISLGAIYNWPLCNHTHGGEGASGYRWTAAQRIMRREVALREMALHPERIARLHEGRANRKVSAEEIRKRSKRVKEVWSDPDLRQAKGQVTKTLWKNAEFRAKVSAGLTPDIRRKMGDRTRGKANNALAKIYEGFISPDGIIHENVSNLHTFCQEYDLQISNMCEVASGKQYAHKGWRAYPLREEPVKKPKPPKTPYTGFVSPNGQVFQVTSSLKAFCQEHNLTLSAMSRVNSGLNPNHKGWVKYIP